MPSPDVIVGPFHIRASDPVLNYAEDAVSLLDDRIIDKDIQGRVLLQSTNRPRGTPEWAWGYNPSVDKCWINLDNAFVEVEYSINHEYAHTFDTKFLTPILRKDFMAMMINVNSNEPVKFWNKGIYTPKGCFVPREAFADAFAKAQAGGEFKRILSRFFKVRVPRSAYIIFLDKLESL